LDSTDCLAAELSCGVPLLGLKRAIAHKKSLHIEGFFYEQFSFTNFFFPLPFPQLQ